MRPVNLIPSDERRGVRGRSRTGPLAYVIVGGLVAALAGVTALVVTGNQVSDRKAEIVRLEAEEEAARARAESLRAFADFASVERSRSQTVSTLARSRFDWERVLRELEYVIPSDVWLVRLEGTVSSDVQLGDSEGVALRDSVPGPALSFVGCGMSHDAVARFAAALRDIDGVTRVAVSRSERPTGEGGGEQAATSASCPSQRFISTFEIVAAFDEVEVDATTQTPVPQPAPSESAPVAAGAKAGDGSGIAEAVQEGEAARESVETQTEEAREAADFAPEVR